MARAASSPSSRSSTARCRRTRCKRYALLTTLGLFGAALLYGDGVITPAITVLGAIEGLEVATPVLARFVVPLSIVILVILFSFQRFGTDRIGKVFGPVMLALVLGDRRARRQRDRPRAGDPPRAQPVVRRALLRAQRLARLLRARRGRARRDRRRGALRGHGALRPAADPLAWFVVAFPALLLNYFGQGALLLRDASAASNPFYRLVPGAAALPDGRARDDGGDHRVAGAHLRRLLAHPAGDPARLLAAPQGDAHLQARGRADLHRRSEHRARRRLPRARARLPVVEQSRGGLRHRRHRHDGDHHRSSSRSSRYQQLGWPRWRVYAFLALFLAHRPRLPRRERGEDRAAAAGSRSSSPSACTCCSPRGRRGRSELSRMLREASMPIADFLDEHRARQAGPRAAAPPSS